MPAGSHQMKTRRADQSCEPKPMEGQPCRREAVAKATTVEEILLWRDQYRQEMNCQIIHDSLHFRKGWTEPYRLMLDDIVVGYGSIAVGGPWKGKPTIFEFYV